MERTPLDNWTILICSKGTNISRFVSAKESITHVVRPLTMYIENLEEGPFALFTLCGLCIDPPRLQHQLHNEIVGHSQCCRFSLKKKPSRFFTACHSKIKECSPLHVYFLPTWQCINTLGGVSNLISGQTYSIMQRIFFTCILSIYWTQMSTDLL